MTNRRRVTIALRLLIIRGIIAVLFTVASGALIVYAMGYRLNWNRLTLEPTVAITMNGDISNAHVMVDNHEVGAKLPVTLSGLIPGRAYYLQITKEGFQLWQRTLSVPPGFIITLDQVRLWPEKATLKPTDPINKTDLCNHNQPGRDATLTFVNGELRTKGGLITRLSEPIVDACWFRDAHHIAYIKNREVHIMENEGTNDTLIYISNEDLDTIAAASNGSTLYIHTKADKWFALVLEQA